MAAIHESEAFDGGGNHRRRHRRAVQKKRELEHYPLRCRELGDRRAEDVVNGDCVCHIGQSSEDVFVRDDSVAVSDGPADVGEGTGVTVHEFDEAVPGQPLVSAPCGSQTLQQYSSVGTGHASDLDQRHEFRKTLLVADQDRAYSRTRR
jgi:hypothetical protein